MRMFNTEIVGKQIVRKRQTGKSSLQKLMAVCMVALCVLMMMPSCKPSLPSGILSKGKMTDILFDYHLAVAMAQTDNGGDAGISVAYRTAVLKKHDVTSAEFDSSMVYYMRHTEMMEEVYKDLADRMNKEVVALGGNGNGMGQFDNLSATGDTANVWNLSSSLVFSTRSPFNEYSFSLDVDSGYHKGDCLMLDFESQFIYQDGMRDGVAVLAVQFANDSTAQSVVHISGSQHYSVQISDNEKLGIKAVKGYFLLSDGGFSSENVSATTLKLMFLHHIKLIRMHPQKIEESKDAAAGDTTKVDSTRSSSPSSASSSSTSAPSSTSASSSSMSAPSSSSMPPSPGSLPRPNGAPVRPVGKPMQLPNERQLTPVQLKSR